MSQSASHLRAACDLLEEKLRAGAVTAVAEVLDSFPELVKDSDAVIELIYTEYLIREELGRSAKLSTYIALFPSLKSRIERIFSIHDALESGERNLNDATDLATDSTGPDFTTNGWFVPGDWLGPYRIESTLGSGGAGVVFKAQHERLGRTVALKVMRSPLLDDRDVRRFLTEAKSAARLVHPHIVQIHEATTYEGYPYLALEYVEGGSLDKKLSQASVAFEQVVDYLIDLADAVEFAHQGGVIHRDVKPANILLTESGECKLSDFGLAKQIHTEGSVSLTQTGAVVGTPAYMAPEQATGDNRSVGPAADIYGLGAVMYEMLTERPPFQAQSTLETLRLIRETEPLPPRRLDAAIPKDLETICLRCLDKKPAGRYKSAAALAADLRRYKGRVPIVARPIKAWERLAKWANRNPWLATLSLLLILVTVAGFAGVVWQWRRAEAGRITEEAARAQAEALLHIQELSVAQQALRNHDVAKTRLILDQTPERNRLWEWRFLDRLVREEPVVYLSPNRYVRNARFSPAGETLALSHGIWGTDKHGQISLVNTDDWNLIAATECPGPVLDIAFTPDGERIYGCIWNPVVRPEYCVLGWDKATGKVVDRLAGELESQTAIATSTDGSRLATGGFDRIIRIWDLQSKAQLFELRGHADSVYQLEFHPTRNELASGSRDGTVRIWDLDKQEQTNVIEARPDVRTIDYSPDGRRIAMGGYQKTVKVHDLMPGAPTSSQYVSDPKSVVINSVRFSPDSRHILATCNSTRSYLLRAEDCQVVKIIGHSGFAPTADFHPDGSYFVTVGVGGEVKKWSVHSRHNFDRFRAVVGASAISPDEKTVAIAAKLNTAVVGLGGPIVTLRQLDDPASTHVTFTCPSGYMTSVAFNRTANLIAVGCESNDVCVWDLETRELVQVIAAHEGRVNDVVFDSLEQLVSAGVDGAIRGWDARTGKSLWSLPGHADGNNALDSKDNLLISGGEDGRFRLWNLESRSIVAESDELGEPVIDVAFANDRSMLVATTGSNATICNYDVKDRDMSRRQQISLPENTTRAVFAMQDRRLLTCNILPGRVQIFDVLTGRLTMDFNQELPHHSRGFRDVHWSPKEDRVFAATDAFVYRWDAMPSEITADGDTESDLPGLAYWHRKQAWYLIHKRYWEPAKFHADRALDYYQRLHEKHPAKYHSELLRSRMHMAAVLQREGQRLEAQTLARLALEENCADVAQKAELVRWDFLMPGEPLVPLDELLKTAEAAYDEKPTSRLAALGVGLALMHLKRFEEAKEILTTTLGLSRGDTALARYLLAITCAELGLTEEADQHLVAATRWHDSFGLTDPRLELLAEKAKAALSN